MINVRNFDSTSGLLEELAMLIVNKNLIPVIGSGFSRLCKAKNGQVPSGEDMTSFMGNQIIDHSEDQTIEKLNRFDFQQLFTIYERKVDKTIKRNYLFNNFTNVELPNTRVNFLEISWPCIYTLNIDDAIETNTNKKVILPFKDYYHDYIDSFDIVFKLHGDVHYHLSYCDKDSRIIFDKKQYINSLRDNKLMLEQFKVDFTDNNLLYIGCSLINEPDLLSVIQESMLASITEKNTYYITINEPDENACILLEDYGVTDIIVVDDLDVFLQQLTTTVSQYSPGIDNDFESYRDKDIINLTKDESNLKFMLNSNNLIQLPFRAFYKPHFFINRLVSKKIISDLHDKAPIHVIYGHRISGKTYCLFDVYEQIKNKDRFFFPSGISITDKMLDEMQNMKKCLFVFDTGTLDTQQIINISNKSKLLADNQNYVLIAVNSSDRSGIDLIQNNDSRYCTSEVRNLFNKTEERNLNEILENSNMPTFLFRQYKNRRGTSEKYYINKTLLDNLYQTALEFSNAEDSFSLPDLSNITSCNDLALIIIFATKLSIDMFDMFYFNLKEEFCSFIETNSILVSMTDISGQQNRRSSSTQIVINARYYLLKVLAEYAKNENNNEIILDAYRYIYSRIDYHEYGFQKSRKMLDFIKYDVINDIFLEKDNTVTSLIKYLYKQLEPELNRAPQFKHQRAKCILWLCNNELSDILDAVKYIDLAEHDTKNYLARRKNQNTQISYDHICYTQAIIYGRLCYLDNYKNIEYVKKALLCYGRAFLNPEHESNIKFLKKYCNDRFIMSDLEALIKAVTELNDDLHDDIISDALALKDEIMHI